MGKLNKLKRKKRQQLARQSAARDAQKALAKKSLLPQPAEWLWPEPPADKPALPGSQDAFAAYRRTAQRLAAVTNEWAGLPTSIDGEQLVIEPSYRYASVFNKPPASEPGITLRNQWYSLQKRSVIFVYEENGRYLAAADPAFHHIGMDLRTLGCSVAWGIEQEHRALRLLASLLPQHAFKHYLLTGMFLESSTRSGVRYVFRKLKPTVAMSSRDQHGGEGDEMRILCTLCMHPVGYYAGSWAGAMCPTDDVIAHLMLMRADEAMLWRRCTQHPACRPESGL